MINFQRIMNYIDKTRVGHLPAFVFSSLKSIAK